MTRLSLKDGPVAVKLLQALNKEPAIPNQSELPIVSRWRKTVRVFNLIYEHWPDMGDDAMDIRKFFDGRTEYDEWHKDEMK